VIVRAGTDCVRAGTGGYKLGSPLGGLAVASYLADRGLPVQLVDLPMDRGIPLTAEARGRLYGAFADELATEAGQISWIGLTMLASTDGATVLGPILRAALPDTPIVLGGYHASCAWPKLLAAGWATAVVLGDGEHAAAQISANLAAGRPLGDGVPNLRTVAAPASPRLPAPPEHAPPLDPGLLAHPDRYPVLNLPTSRGCPWGCAFCLERSMRGYDARDLDRVALQLEVAARASTTREVYLADPVFGVDPSRLERLCALLRAAPFRFAASTRVDVIPPRLVPAVAGAGLEVLYVGLESASPEALLRMNKVRSPERARRYAEASFDLFAALFEHDITPVIGFLPGYPGDAEVDLERCTAWLDRLRAVYDASGADCGFVTVAADAVEVYDSSPLAGALPPDVRLGPEEFAGMRLVERPSAALDRSMVDAWQQERQRRHVVTSRAGSRLRFFGGLDVAELARRGSPALRDGVLYPAELPTGAGRPCS